MQKNNPISRSHSLIRNTIIALFLGLTIAIPRVLAPDHYVMVDEPLWLYRSANFLNALKEKDWQNTYQIYHPGVSTMWAGAAGLLFSHPEVFQAQKGQLNYRQFEELLAALKVTPLKVLAFDRLFTGFVTAITLLLAFFYAYDLIGLLPALLGFFLIAFDPFHLALTRILHPDGFFSNFMILAVLSFIHYWKVKRLSSLVISGVFSGLSWITKSPGLFLFPFMGLLLLILNYVEVKKQRKQSWKDTCIQTVKLFCLWGGTAWLISVLLWPALLTDPLRVIKLILSKGFQAAQEGHEQALFFNGVIYTTGQMGFKVWEFYPLSFLWRTTPVIILGLMFNIIFTYQPKYILKERQFSFISTGLWLFGLGFLFFMHLGDKKFDRYILPVFLAADLLAAIGFVQVATALFHKRPLKQSIIALLLIPVIGLQAYSSLSIFPYMVSYYNPLLGGPSKAVKIMDVGEGEGLELAAMYLNQKANARELNVFAWYATGCFSYFFDGTTRQIRPVEQRTDKRLQSLEKSDYIVIYINQEQRGLGKLYLDFVAGKPIEKKIILNDIEYARIYKIH